MKTLVDQLKISYYGNPVLRRKALPIRNFTSLISEVSEKMFEIMRANYGVGLAAPQVGLPWQMFVMDLGEPMTFINPQMSCSGPLLTKDEGCLSLPGIYINVTRPRDVYIHAQKVDGEKFKVKYSGLYSRCTQHEYDHLIGKLIIDKTNLINFSKQILQLPSGVPTKEELQLMCEWEKHDVLELPTDATKIPQYSN